MNVEQQLTAYLTDHLIPDPNAPLTPAYIDHCEAFDDDPDLFDLWDILHWSTQESICQNLRQLLS